MKGFLVVAQALPTASRSSTVPYVLVTVYDFQAVDHLSLHV